MAKNTISMRKFRSSLTKISRLAKSGYNSISSVAKQIIATVTTIASKMSVLSENSGWQGASESLPSDGYQSYYDNAGKAEESYLKGSLQNISSYKDEVISDIYMISDALSQNADQIGYRLSDAVKNAFGEVSEDFFLSGEKSGKSFGGGFLSSVEESMEAAKQMMVSAMQSVSQVMNAAAAAKDITNITYSNPSYNFYSSNQTVSEQLKEARNAETISALRRV
ncbi:MAG: hypothetical protein WCX81_03350 [Monoglobales bacterium]